jgi:glycerol-3-phosphate dehydrogenase
VLKAEVVHAAREEMAMKLADVVFRRTDLGSGGRPLEEGLTACAEIMGKELHWGKVKVENEIEEVQGMFPICRGGETRRILTQTI